MHFDTRGHQDKATPPKEHKMTYQDQIDRIPVVTSDYQTLVDALARNGARCMWQIPQKYLAKSGLNFKTIECWELKDGRQIITQEWASLNGWNYYMATQHGKIDDCINELGLMGRAI